MVHGLPFPCCETSSFLVGDVDVCLEHHAIFIVVVDEVDVSGSVQVRFSSELRKDQFRFLPDAVNPPGPEGRRASQVSTIESQFLAIWCDVGHSLVLAGIDRHYILGWLPYPIHISHHPNIMFALSSGAG